MATKKTKKHTKRTQSGPHAAAEQDRAETPRGEDLFERRYARLLARRVPVEEIKIGTAYVIHSRRGGVGVAVRENGRLGYVINREKWGICELFVEVDWNEGPPYGTAIPLRVLDAEPPTDDEQLLAWLAEREAEHRDEIRAAWQVILGKLLLPDTPSEG